MRIYYDYPLATEENMKAVQNEIIAGKDCDELCEMFGETVVWDCIAILSGNEHTPWALVDFLNGNEQIGIDDWQTDLIDNYISDVQNSVHNGSEHIEHSDCE